MEKVVEWNEGLNIGIKVVDEAHRKLFSIVRRIQLLTEDTDKSQWACIEGVKYFKNYTIIHFQQEEEYMRSINYPRYAAHKQIHDNMRERILPALERDLEISNYSRRSVEQFVDVCVNWLTKHIMIEDKAIIRRGRQ